MLSSDKVPEFTASPILSLPPALDVLVTPPLPPPSHIIIINIGQVIQLSMCIYTLRHSLQTELILRSTEWDELDMIKRYSRGEGQPRDQLSQKRLVDQY